MHQAKPFPHPRPVAVFPTQTQALVGPPPLFPPACTVRHKVSSHPFLIDVITRPFRLEGFHLFAASSMTEQASPSSLPSRPFPDHHSGRSSVDRPCRDPSWCVPRSLRLHTVERSVRPGQQLRFSTCLLAHNTHWALWNPHCLLHGTRVCVARGCLFLFYLSILANHKGTHSITRTYGGTRILF